MSLGLGALDRDGVKTLGRLAGDVRDVAVELLLCALLVVSLSCDSESHSVWDVLDSHLPDLLVELWVETDVLCTHVLRGELLDSLYSPWCSLLELHSVHMLVKVDGVITSDNIVHSLVLLARSHKRYNRHTDLVAFGFLSVGAI